MATVARASGVSQGAISSLLNDRSYGIRVSEQTRNRVYRVCRELGYVPNDLRAIVRMYPEVGEVCLLVADTLPDPFSDAFCARLMSGIAAATEEKSHSITIARYQVDREYAADAPELPHPIKTATASRILMLGQPNLSLVEMLLSRNLPLAMVGGELNHPGVNSFLTSYAEASQKAVEYLLKLGHRHLAILSGPFGTTDPFIIELNRGIKAACDAGKLTIDPQNIVYGELNFASGAAAVDHLLARPKPPTALFCLSDLAAAGAFSQVLARGLAPAQFSVLGCGNDLISTQIHPGLSTVHLSVEELGALALRDVERRLREEELTDSLKMMVPARLIERESCAAPGKAAAAK